jgi:peptidoglycan hydrolase-like protein with peptidoglycan-binding domain
MRWLALISVITFFATWAIPAGAQVAEIQRYLAALKLDPGPADGAAGPRTMKAWAQFLKHRGLPPDTPMDAAGLAEIAGQSRISLPDTDGIDLEINAGRLPSRDSYVLDPNDDSAFLLRLKKGDFDAVDYRKSDSVFEQAPGFNLNKQRAELVSQILRADRAYTVDFDVRVSNARGGSFFQFHGPGNSGITYLMAYEDQIRLSAGPDLQQAVFRGKWLGEWQSIRVVVYPSSTGESWFRIYVNGEQTLDTLGQSANLVINGGRLHFGLYRGNSETETTAEFRKLRLQTGDAGQP